MFTNLRWLLHRIRKDYLSSAREAEYRELLETARTCGYAVMSLIEFHLMPDPRRPPRLLVMRHDVDNRNPRGVRLFFDLERAYGVSATYYFRLQTLEMTDIVDQLLAHGFDIGYHFEEAASVAKMQRITSAADLRSAEIRMQIESLMSHNIERVNAQLGRPVTSLCGHGDFVNRRLGIENRFFLSESVRRKHDLLFEAADSALLDQFDLYLCDMGTGCSLWYGDQSPIQAMECRVPRLYVLTHPRHWHPAPATITLGNLKRLCEELDYRIAGRRRMRPGSQQ